MAESNLPLIIAGIRANIKTATKLKNVYAYKPKAFSSSAMFFFIPASFRLIEPAYGEMALEWTFAAQASIPYLNEQEAERQMAEILVQVLSISGTDLDAGEAIVDGQVLVEGGELGTVSPPGQTSKWYVCNFTIKATERFPYTYAL